MQRGSGRAAGSVSYFVRTGAVEVPAPSHDQCRPVGVCDRKSMLISTGGGDALRLLLLLSTIILARAVSYPKRYPNELEFTCPLRAKLLRSD